MHLTTTHKFDAKSSSVHSVTVFRSRCAEVVRKFTISLKTGDNVVEITHLPHSMVPDSLRVAGFGNAMLSDVVCTPPKVWNARPSQDDKSDALITLEQEKALIKSQRSVIDYQATVLVNYSRSLTGEHVPPEDMLSFLQRFITLGDENAKAVIELDARLRAVEKKIQNEIDEPTTKAQGHHSRYTKVKLTISAEEDHTAEISLTYLVNNASWKPIFDLRAVTGTDGKPTSKLALHYRASVTQSTGEDWFDSVLNLSTASPNIQGTKIPTWASLKIVPRATPFSWGQPPKAPNLLIGAPNQFQGQQQQQQMLQQQQQQMQQQAQQQTQQQAPRFGGFGGGGGGLFGQPASSQAPSLPGHAPAAGLFGTTGTTTGFGLFGTSNTAPSSSLFGSSTTAATSEPATVAPPQAEDTSDDFVELAPTLPQLELASAVATENSIAANFQVAGSVNIPSDDSSHKVAIAVLSLNAKVETIAVPRSMNGAYLQCTIHNSTKDTHLLPGTMGIYLDEGYITNSSIPHVAPGDSFKSSLGQDHSVAVSLDQKAKRIEVPTSLFSAQQEKTLYTTRVTVRNKRETTIKGLIVRDVVPVADGTNVKVVLVQPEGFADTEEGKEVKVKDMEGVSIRWCKSVGDKGGMKEGRVEWIVDLGARELKTLVLEWEVIAPSGIKWAYDMRSA